MSISLYLFVATIVITATAHVPVRGRSLRDYLRRPQTGVRFGLRLTPGLSNALSAEEIAALADDGPVPIDGLSLHHLPPEIRGEHAHRYFRAVQQRGQEVVPWTHLVVTLPADATASGDGGTADALDSQTGLSPAATAACEFLIHRLGLLGIRARPLTDKECAQSADIAAVVELRRSGSSHRAAGLKRSQQLWLTQRRDITVTSGPAQVIGVGKSGQTVTMCPADVPRLRLIGDVDDVCALLTGTLSLGYRIGIRTSRPQKFVTALELGAVLIAHAGDKTADIIVIDEREPNLETGAARIVEVYPPDEICGADAADSTVSFSDTTPSNSVERVCAPMIPQLYMGMFAWTLSTARSTSSLRPLPPRASAGFASASSRPEPRHPNDANRA